MVEVSLTFMGEYLNNEFPLLLKNVGLALRLSLGKRVMLGYDRWIKSLI